MNDVKKAMYSSWGSVEMTCTLLSPLSVLYIGVVPTTSNSMQLSHSQCSTPYFNSGFERVTTGVWGDTTKGSQKS
jgi:hypothetical protein